MLQLRLDVDPAAFDAILFYLRTYMLLYLLSLLNSILSCCFRGEVCPGNDSGVKARVIREACRLRLLGLVAILLGGQVSPPVPLLRTAAKRKAEKDMSGAVGSVSNSDQGDCDQVEAVAAVSDTDDSSDGGAGGAALTQIDADLTTANMAALLRGTSPSLPLRLVGCCVRGVDLSGFELAGADFGGASLDGTVLYRAHLSGANLEGAKLGHVNLRGLCGQFSNLPFRFCYPALLDLAWALMCRGQPQGVQPSPGILIHCCPLRC